MQQEFTPNIFFKILYTLLGAGFALFGILILAAPHFNSAFYYIFPLITMPLGVIFIGLALRRKVIIENDLITVTDTFKTRQIAFGEIKGVRFGQKVIQIVPNKPGNAVITIRNFTEFGNSSELANYLTSTFPDLDAADVKDQQEQLLADTNLGFTAEDRQGRLDTAKKIAILYNTLGVIVAVMFLILKQPLFTIIAIAYPLLGIIIMLSSKGLIKFFSQRNKSIYPFIFFGFIAPAIVLIIKTFTLYHFYSTDNIWLPFLGAGGIIAVLLFIIGVNRSLSGGIVGQVMLMLFASLAFTFGSIGQLNCSFDTSPDQIYKASVLGHHITHGKNTAYYLYLSTWGPCHQQKQIDVGSKMYNEVNVGDSVKVILKPGLLHIPWFVVSR